MPVLRWSDELGVKPACQIIITRLPYIGPDSKAPFSLSNNLHVASNNVYAHTEIEEIYNMMASKETDNLMSISEKYDLMESNDVYDILELFGDLEELDDLASSKDLITPDETEDVHLKGMWRRFQELTVDLWNSGLGLGDTTGIVSLLLLVALLLLLLILLLALILVCRCLRRRRQSAKKTSRQNSTSHLITKEVNQLIKAGSDFTKIGDEVIKIESNFEAGRSQNSKSRQTKGSLNIGQTRRNEIESSPSSWESWSLDSLEQRDRFPLGGHACVV